MVQDLFEIRIIGVSKTLVEILKTQKYLDKMNIFFQCGQYSVGISRIHWPMYDDDDIWNHPLYHGQKWFQKWQFSNPYFTEWLFIAQSTKIVPLFGNCFAHNALYDYYYCCCKTLQQCRRRQQCCLHANAKIELQFHIWQTTPLPAAREKTSFLLI